jgi:hypothetical protein
MKKRMTKKKKRTILIVMKREMGVNMRMKEH